MPFFRYKLMLWVSDSILLKSARNLSSSEPSLVSSVFAAERRLVLSFSLARISCRSGAACSQRFLISSSHFIIVSLRTCFLWLFSCSLLNWASFSLASFSDWEARLVASDSLSLMLEHSLLSDAIVFIAVSFSSLCFAMSCSTSRRLRPPLDGATNRSCSFFVSMVSLRSSMRDASARRRCASLKLRSRSLRSSWTIKRLS
mmetsp:Transcript_11505/g.22891  ORF Transcript_11505/g.22891 Transcript_11505/m.22891 type:complete len:201 (-) Transcript_11505:2723-3325(-)